MKNFFRFFALAPLVALLLPAQTLEQAEALRKARRYMEANDMFRQLVDRNPDNVTYRVRWGRLFLEHWQPDEAGKLFDEALELNPKDAGAYLGKALLAAEDYSGAASKLAAKALELDPKLVEAQELLASLALEDDKKDQATAEAKKALAIDPESVGAKAVLATIDWLADKKESSWDPHAAKGYEFGGKLLMLNRRYEESILLYRKAVAMDPTLFTARSQLGISLMRLGRNDEAYELLKTCWDNGFQDKPTKNSLQLMDSYKNFVKSQNGKVILKLHKKETDVLHPFFEDEANRIVSTYEKKYKIKLDSPVQIEVYPDHEDFAVRTMGMPGLGALGVTFVGHDGGFVAMDSPSGRRPGEFHWASTLWHEMSHVFTLTMTNSRVPRWFTEGIAVHEETAASSEWGDRLGPEEILAVKNHQLLPIADLDRGFIHPTAPGQVIVSYFQAGRICDYITDKWGWDTILAMLKDFSQGEETVAVIKKELKLEPAEFDREFLTQLNASVKKTVDNFDRWKDGVKQLSELAKKKDNDGVIKLGTELRDLYPDYVEMGNVYEFLADAYVAKGNKAAAEAELERYVHIGGRDPVLIKRLAKDEADDGKGKEAAAVLDRLTYIYPMDPEEHRRLGDLWLAQGNATGAIREFRALLARNPIDPAQAHFDLARAYNLNHQPDPARDELLAALEIAPGFRPAQKLLLELSH